MGEVALCHDTHLAGLPAAAMSKIKHCDILLIFFYPKFRMNSKLFYHITMIKICQKKLKMF